MVERGVQKKKRGSEKVLSNGPVRRTNSRHKESVYGNLLETRRSTQVNWAGQKKERT